MRCLYIFALTCLLLPTVSAQDASSDRWTDNGNETVIDLPSTSDGRVVISKGNTFGPPFNELLRLRVSYSANDYMSFRNATFVGNSLVPAIFSYNESGNGSSLMLLGVTNYANDTGNSALINFNARKYNDNTLTTGSSAITNRPLFSWNNHATNYMQMTANGNLGLGTTSPQAQLHTTGSVRFEGIPTIAATYIMMTEVDGTVSKYARPGNTLPVSATVNTTTNAVLKFNASGVMLNSQINDNGTGVGIGGAPSANAKLTLYGTLSLMSDERQKTNITRMSHAGDKLDALNGYYYTWRGGDGQKQVGFLAQEVERVLPEAVSQNSEGTRFLNYDGLIPLLTEAIKEQRTLLNAQTRQIEELQREVRALKHRK